MTRLDLIQFYIDKYKYKKYLEIGVLGGEVFFNKNYRFRKRFSSINNILNRYFECTSDVFFSKYAKNVISSNLDICFVDGMHEFDYALKDILNSLEYLNDNGVIIVHDCNPTSKEAEVDFHTYKNRGFTGAWNGDVWKAILYLRCFRPDLEVKVLDSDYGLGIIRKKVDVGNSFEINFDSKEQIENLTYEDLDKNRNLYLNLISEHEFKMLCE